MMLIRCPYSHFSSVWKVYNKDKTMLTYLIKLWKLYAEEFNNPESKNIIKVVYDEYVVNDRYIINTLQKLGINNININNEVFNCVGENMTVKDVAEICKKYNKKLKTISTDDPIPNNGYTLSNQKIKNEGFKFLYLSLIHISEPTRPR